MTPLNQQTSREGIIAATLAVLAEAGVAGCSVDAIVDRAGCARGLLNYHFGSKAGLLSAAAEQLRTEREEDLRSAELAEGTAALDACWSVLADRARTGRTAAFLALASNPSTRSLVRSGVAHDERVARMLAGALGVPDLPIPIHLLAAFLEGLEVRLSAGLDADRGRESYESFWLAILRSAD